MADSDKQMELKSTEEVNVEMRRSFSWDRAFYTSDGFLNAEELSSMIEGGGEEEENQLQKIEEIENLEAKLFQEIEGSTQTSTEASNVISNLSSGKKDFQTKKVTTASSSSTPVKTVQPTRSPPSSVGKKVKSPAKRSASSKTDKTTPHSLSKTSAGITTRNKKAPVSARMSRTPPASPVSSGSSSPSSTFSVNQRSKRSSSVPRRSSLNNEKPSTINAKRNDEWKPIKNKVVPSSSRMSRTPPASPGSSGSSSSSTFSVNQRSKRTRISSVNIEKPSANNARRNATMNNTGTSRTTPSSPVSSGSSPSSTFSANHRSKRSSSVPRRSSVNSEKRSDTNARRNDEWKDSKPAVRLIPKTQSSISLKIKPPPIVSHPTSPSELFNSSSSSRAQQSESSSSSSSTCKVNQRSKPVGRSKSTSKNRPIKQQLAASRTETRCTNASKTRKLSAPKTAAAVDAGLKPISQKTNTTTPSKKQSSMKAKSSSGISRGAGNIILVSPEVLDIKGKLNALKMEINMQKKDRCKETKMSHDESSKGESSSIIHMNNQAKSK